MQTYQSITLISDMLAKRGFSYRKTRIEGKEHRIFTKGLKLWITPYGYVRYPFVSQTLRLLSIQKELAYDYVRSVGYAVPQTALCKKGDGVRLKTIRFDYPMVVKPVTGSGSVGVIRNITDEQMLLASIASVHRAGEDVLVQQQFAGQEVRLTVLDGTVVSTCLRAVPQLVGDGSHTLVDLLEAENQSRAEMPLAYIVYPQLTSELITRAVDMRSVPALGEVVTLGESTLISGGASVYSIDDTVHGSYKTIALDMACKLNASFLVVDLLATDYRQAATNTNYVFLEFNTAPALKLYYSLRDGKQYDIVPFLAQKIEEALGET